MKVCYYALVPQGPYDVGDIIPEAVTWAYVDVYVRNGQIAPVLVASLPAAARHALDAWEADWIAQTTPPEPEEPEEAEEPEVSGADEQPEHVEEPEPENEAENPEG